MAQRSNSGTATKQTRDTTRRDSHVEEFLDQFARRLTSGDTRSLASMWGTPALVVGNHGVQAISSREEVEQFFSGAREHYNSRGIADTEADIQKLNWVTERIALVEVRWPHLDRQGNEVGEETSTYVLRRDDADKLQLCVAVMHGEAAADRD